MHASRESYSKTRYAAVEVIDSQSVHYNSLRIGGEAGSIRPFDAEGINYPGWAMEWERSNCTQSTKNTSIKTQVAKYNHGR